MNRDARRAPGAIGLRIDGARLLARLRELGGGGRWRAAGSAVWRSPTPTGKGAIW
jgi:hypothetical protein